MRLPELTELPCAKDNTEEFTGYNHNLRNSPGEWYDQKNMTTDYYPVASPRNKRSEQIKIQSYDLPETLGGYRIDDKVLGLSYTDNKLLVLQPFCDKDGKEIGSWLTNNKLPVYSAGFGQTFDGSDNIHCDLHPMGHMLNDEWRYVTMRNTTALRRFKLRHFCRETPSTNQVDIGLYDLISRNHYQLASNNINKYGIELSWHFYQENIEADGVIGGIDAGSAENPLRLLTFTKEGDDYIFDVTEYITTIRQSSIPYYIFIHKGETLNIVIVYSEDRKDEITSVYSDEEVNNAEQIRNATELYRFLDKYYMEAFNLDKLTSAEQVHLSITANNVENESIFFLNLIDNKMPVEIEASIESGTYPFGTVLPYEYEYDDNTKMSTLKCYPDGMIFLNRVLHNIQNNEIVTLNFYNKEQRAAIKAVGDAYSSENKSNLVNGLKRSIVRMGSYICVFPDGVICETANQDSSKSILMVKQAVRKNHIKLETVISDSESATGYSTIDSRISDNEKYRFRSGQIQHYITGDTNMWVNQQTNVMIYVNGETGTFDDFKTNDVVTMKYDTELIPGDTLEGSFNGLLEWDAQGGKFVEKSLKILKKGTFLVDGKNTDYIIVNGFVVYKYNAAGNKTEFSYDTVDDNISFTRKMPDIALACESQNRIWCCSKDGHEIYASVLGNPYNFYDYSGIATDSYAVNVGTDGEFTGCINYLGRPLFFKENALHSISGSYPSNNGSMDGMSYAVTTTTDFKGVEKGSERSLAIIDNILYYKSSMGIVAYDGATTTVISEALGKDKYKNAVAGVYKNKYYISMQDSQGIYHLFVYDTRLGTWCKEDDTQVLQFLPVGTELLYVSADNDKICCISEEDILKHTDYKKESDFEWYCETGTFGYSYPNNKYISRFQIRMQMAEGAKASIYIQYNSDGIWHRKGEMSGKGIRSHLIPIVPIRCDHMKIRIAGKGDVKIYSIAKIFEEGGDV